MGAVWNGLLALASLAVGLALAEGALRLFDHYAHLAEPPKRSVLSPVAFRHPDTGAPHAVVHNNLGSRQHRNFSERDLTEGVNIAFFGDSFTENLRLPAPYSFTEVLDFLLNHRPDSARRDEAPERARFNVLNFGVDGSGPGRQYLRYRGLPFRRHLRHVFYVYYANDIVDLHRAAEWQWDGTGGLVRRIRREASPWGRVLSGLSGLHLTYLALDVWHRLGPPANDAGETIADADAVAVFGALLRRWRSDVEANGGAFHIVLLPSVLAGGRGRAFPHRDRFADWNIVDLDMCFAATSAGRIADWRFARDKHWNAAGNMFAAHCLYRHLERAIDLPRRTDAALGRARGAYYRAFHESDDWRGQRFLPGAPWALPAEATADAAQRIVGRYLALGDDAAAAAAARLLEDYRQIAATTPAVRSAWNLHPLRARRALAYLKAPCADEDRMRTFFFLRVRPAGGTPRPGTFPRASIGAEFVSPNRADGYVGIPVGLADAGPHPVLVDGKCLMTVTLPEWPIGTVWTGGSGRATQWSAKFYWDLQHLRRVHRATAARTPAASGPFDVHHIDGALAFVRAPCTEQAVRHRFMLHLFAAGAKRPAGRFGNFDFDFVDRGAVFEGRCVAVAPLPRGAAGRARVGQFEPGKGPLWQAEFALD